MIKVEIQQPVNDLAYLKEIKQQGKVPLKKELKNISDKQFCGVDSKKNGSLLAFLY
jgi:hypothetical protein